MLSLEELQIIADLHNSQFILDNSKTSSNNENVYNYDVCDYTISRIRYSFAYFIWSSKLVHLSYQDISITSFYGIFNGVYVLMLGGLDHAQIINGETVAGIFFMYTNTNYIRVWIP